MRQRVAIFVFTLLLVATVARPAHANGVPIRVQLSYIAGLSNWGPQDAAGDAEISFSEATVKIDARKLSVLRGETYQAWLAKSGTNRAIKIGSFAPATDGTAGLTGRLSTADGYDFDLVVITVEPQPDTDPAPSEKRSIAGFFTPIKKVDAAPTLNSDAQPSVLPNTGDPMPAPPTAVRTAAQTRRMVALSLFAIGGASLYMAIRRPFRPRQPKGE